MGIAFRHGDNILQVEIGVRHVDLDLESTSHRRAKKCVGAKANLQTQKANTDSNIRACQPI